MGRKNNSPSDEIEQITKQYEAAKAENRSIYLDGFQFADIACNYSSEKEYKKAQEVINDGLSIHPDNSDLLIEQAYLYLDTGRLPMAEKVADFIDDDTNPNVLILRGEILLNQGRLEDTRSLLSVVEPKTEFDIVANIIYLYLELGYSEEAKAWIDKCEPYHKGTERFMALTADYLGETHQYEAAIEMYNKLLDKDPYHTPYWISLAKCLFVTGEIEKTIEACDLALAANDRCGEAYAQRGHCYFYLNNFTAAIKDYKAAMEHKGILRETGYWLIGLAYKDCAVWDKAEICLRSTIEIYKEKGDGNNPFLADVYNNLAIVLLNTNRADEACEMCEKAVEVDPENIGTQLTLGRIHIRKKKFTKAFDIILNALRGVQEPEMWYEAGLIYEEEKRIPQSKLFYQQAYLLDSKYENVAGKMAALSLMEGDVDAFFVYNEESEFPFDEEIIAHLLTDPRNPKETEKTLKQILRRFKKEKKEKEKEKKEKGNK